MKWVCQICGYLHEEDEPPNMCPVCGAPAAKFVERYDDENDAAAGHHEEDDEADYYGEFE